MRDPFTPARIAAFVGSLQWTLTAVAAFLLVHTLGSWSGATVPVLEEGSPLKDASTEPGLPASPQDLSGIWQRPLRQALIEPKAPDPAPTKPAPPPPPVALPRLVATFVESGRAWALILDEKGVPRVRSAGGTVGEFEIVEVSPGAATLRRKDARYEIRAFERSGGTKPHEARLTERRP